MRISRPLSALYHGNGGTLELNIDRVLCYGVYGNEGTLELNIDWIVFHGVYEGGGGARGLEIAIWWIEGD